MLLAPNPLKRLFGQRSMAIIKQPKAMTKMVKSIKYINGKMQKEESTKLISGTMMMKMFISATDLKMMMAVFIRPFRLHQLVGR